jgi:50S ribosomal protein L16 3-hydroxylase
MQALPGGLDAREFLRRHWQKEPLLVRGAFPAFEDPVDVRGVLALACARDASARLVRRSGRGWSLQHGPFRPAVFKQLPRRDWTVLVQDTNFFSDRAARLLEQFDFIAHARVDDLMVSYAVPGGTVGPHVDSYDVFLLQGRGRRRWQISRDRDHAFRPGLPLRILRRFEPEEEWVLEPGDLLYLPPGMPHYGVALTECLTWSVGFRAPTDRELAAAFLDFLHERLDPPGQYADPGARPARDAGRIPERLARHVARAVRAVRWSARDAREFGGRFLTEPKANAVFCAPAKPTGRDRFARACARRGLRLDGRSRLLFSGSMWFMNGERVEAPRAARRALRALANARRLEAPLAAPREFWDLAHAWYIQGFVHPGARTDT